MKIYTTVVRLILCQFVLMGCSTAGNTVSEYPAINEQASAIIISPTVAALPSPIPPTEAATKPPTQSVPTATSTRKPTLTPSPTKTTPTPVPYPTFDVASSTLSEETATQNLIELLETNGDCELPCWWGMTPGETHTDSIETVFVPLGFDWYRDYEELKDNTPYKASTYLVSEDNVIQSIQVYGGVAEETYDHNEAWRPYAIPQVIESLGMPDDIYVYYPFRFDPGGMQAYRLFFYYHDLGVEIDYLGKASLVDEKAGWARACPNILETDEINLFLFQSGTIPDYLEQTLPSSSLPLPEPPEGKSKYDMASWEQATESSLDEFERLFTESDEGTVCFDFKTYWTGN